MPKFRVSKDGGINWTEYDEDVPFNIGDVTDIDNVLAQPLGSIVADYGIPQWTTPPSFDRTAYTEGDLIVLREGIVSPSGLTVELAHFHVDGVDRSAELSGLTWDSTGAGITDAQTMTARFKVVNGDKATNSVEISATIGAGTAYVESDLVMTIETKAPNEQFALRLRNAGTYDAKVDMGDGRGAFPITTHNDPKLTATYATPGTHTIRMSGKAGGLLFGGTDDRHKVRTVQNFGKLGWEFVHEAFAGCSGLTSFVAGNCDTPTTTNWYRVWGSCVSMTTCNISGFDFSGLASINLGAAWAGCTALTFVDLTALGSVPVTTADEAFYKTSGNALVGLDPSTLNIRKMAQVGNYGGGFFNFIQAPTVIDTATYDRTLLNWAAQLPKDVPFDLAAGQGVICDFQKSKPTMGGAVEAARRTLVENGFFIEDDESDLADVMVAPTLGVNGDTQITVTIARPSSSFPIQRYDLQYSTDQTNWTVIQGIVAPYAETPYALTGLTAGLTYYVQVRAKIWMGESAWSPSASVALTSGAVTFSIQEIAQEPVITADDGNVTVTIASGDYAGTYAVDHLGNTLTVAMFETAPTCLLKPVVTGTVAAGETLTIKPGLWIYDGADPGDQTWQHKLDGVNIPGGTDLDHVITNADKYKAFTVEESFGGVTVETAPIALEFGPSMPDQMGAPGLVVDGPTQITATLAADPNDGGTAIISRDLRYSLDDINWAALTGVTSPVVLTPLAVGRTYFVQTRAVNAEGPGPWSESNQATTELLEFNPMTQDAAIWRLWDASDATTVAVSGTNVTRWTDKINSKVLPGAAITPPVYDGVDSINGLAVIRSDLPTAVNGRKSFSVVNETFPNANYLGIHGIFRIKTVPDQPFFSNASGAFGIKFSRSSSPQGLEVYSSSSNTAFHGNLLWPAGNFAGPFNNSDEDIRGVRLLQIEMDNVAGTIKYWIDGRLAVEGALAYPIPHTVNSELHILANSGATRGFNGDVGELIVTGAVGQQVEYFAYLSNKWGMS